MIYNKIVKYKVIDLMPKSFFKYCCLYLHNMKPTNNFFAKTVVYDLCEYPICNVNYEGRV